MSRKVRDQFAGTIGNFLEHYDKALYGLLAPFIAPLFFNKDPLTALILTYSLIPLAVLMRPLGSLFFGRLSDIHGSRSALFYSLLGMGLATLIIGCLPGHQLIGRWAPVLLTLCKMVQSFCSAGETTVGALFVLEKTPQENRGLASSFYNVSSISGVLFGSLVVAILSGLNLIEPGWRFVFFAGGITALFGFVIRYRKGPNEKKALRKNNLSVLTILNQHRMAFITIIVASGFSHVTYCLSFTLMNGFVPLINPITKANVMQVNTLLLIADMLLLPCFGYLSKRYGKEKLMCIGAFCCAFGAIPLFALLANASLITVIAVRVLIILAGVAFAAPYYAWAFEQAPFEYRYLLLSFGSALGLLCIGAPSAAVSLWLYKVSKWSGAPGIYLTLAGLGAGWVVSRSYQRKLALE